MSAQPDDFLGKVVLGRYRIVHNLAKGGMGVIYLARSEGAAGFAKPVVVKRIITQYVDDDGVVQMFKREARIMSNMRHPGVVSVLDFGHEDGAYLMVLEYVHGFHAGRWRRFVQTRGDNFPTEFAVHIVICVLDALHYAHTLIGADGRALRIIHRDVSPSNVLIDVDGHVKLADFGIARMQSDQTEWKTGETTVKGKLPYLAPELFRGSEPGPETDVYSAGVVLHEILSGRNEFRADDPTQTVARVLQHVPERLDVLRDDVSKEIADVVAKALEKKPEDRYKTALEFSQALRAARKLSGDEAAVALAQAAAKDFHDPSIAAALGIDDLATLEKAWREPRVFPPREPKRHQPEEGAEDTGSYTDAEDRTVAERGLASPRRSRGRGSRGVLVGVGVFLLGVGATVGAGAYLIPKLRTPPSGGDIVIEQIPNSGNPPMGGADGDASTPAGERDAATRLGRDAGRRREVETHAPSVADISLPFRRRTAEITACFRDHVAQLEGAPQITVRFSVGTDGRVTEAELIPGSLAATDLGRCLIAIARTTQFAARPEPISFRIPVGARRAP